jgi:hypothetical protein
MADRKVFAIAVVGIGLAVGSAHPAVADAPAAMALNGVFTQYRDSAKRSTWVVVSTCDPAANCSGNATSSRGWTALVNRVAGGPWLVERDSPNDGWVCPDGSHTPAHLSYSLDPVTLSGTVESTKQPGTCGSPATATDSHPIHLVPVGA